MNRMPDYLRDSLFPDGAELIAAAHDIGKVSPTFQKKIYKSLNPLDESVLDSLNMVNDDQEKIWGGHSGVSQSTVSALHVGKYIPEIIGRHHGFSPPGYTQTATCELFGGTEWNEKRKALLEQMKDALCCDFPVVQNNIQATILSGLTTVSDWIGSGSLFDTKDGDGPEKISLALDNAGYMQPQVIRGLSFQDVFGFSPKDSQVKLIDVVDRHGVYVLEAPMGMGKTEAALYAAYRLLEMNKAAGIYFALPTQLTSDKIHERVNHFLQRILSDDSPNKKALLVHGDAWLKQFEMGEEGNPGQSWFSHGKRGILAPFAVGTIDQALMAVMNVKHGFVRAFGLAGKVVILDEVHSYDSFTGTLLDKLVDDLRQLHCTVIILSATLTQERRLQLTGIRSTSVAYPLITAHPFGEQPLEVEVEPIPDVSVMISIHREDTFAIQSALERAKAGQQVLWIENTVDKAQERYKQMAAITHGTSVECGLLHSQFTKMDRAINENNWVTLFGKQGAAKRGDRGRILVGTQVLEQSLDIDADFLVTRIAPTDMLLQRMGRLWRHEENIRPAGARREALILAPDLTSAIQSPSTAFGLSAMIYAPYVLCRTLSVWQDIKNVNIPGQIRELIEATYVTQQETGKMARHLNKLKDRREKLEELALSAVSKANQTISDENVATRYSDINYIDVLLLRSYKYDEEKNGSFVTLLNDENIFIPKNGRTIGKEKQREITAKMMQYTLKMPNYIAPLTYCNKVDWLKDYFYLGICNHTDKEKSTLLSPLLRVALVDDDGWIRGLNGKSANPNYALRYDSLMGYEHHKLAC